MFELICLAALAFGSLWGSAYWQSYVPESGLTLPSPHYLKHPPQYLPPTQAYPLSMELKALEDAARESMPPACPAGTAFGQTAATKDKGMLSGAHIGQALGEMIGRPSDHRCILPPLLRQQTPSEVYLGWLRETRPVKRAATADIVVLEADKLVPRRGEAVQKHIRGQHFIRPDGTISLGVYGSLHVQGMTCGEIQASVEHLLSPYFTDPRISVELTEYAPGGPGRLVHSKKNAPAQVLIELTVLEIDRSLLPPDAYRALQYATGRNGDGASFGIVANDKETRRLLACFRVNGHAAIQTRPRITTMSGQEATVQIGSAVPIQILGKDGPCLGYKEIGTKLTVLPVVKSDGKLVLIIGAEISNVAPAGESPNRVTACNTLRVQTTAALEAGKTLAIGGMSNGKKELLILATPQLVEAVLPVAPASYTEECETPAARKVEPRRTVSVKDVVRMAKKGIAQEIIIRQIQLTDAVFDLTVDDIIELHDQGVSEAILRAMQERHQSLKR